MPANLSKLALGGIDAKDLIWTLELEPFSTFSYSVMRQNIFSLCETQNHEKMRKSIIYLEAPKQPTKSQLEQLRNRFSNELKVLNEEQKEAVLKSILA